MILVPSNLVASALAGGFVLGFAAILSLGPQNLRLIEAGITRSHPGTVATIGYLSEIMVVAAGIAFVGSLALSHPQLVFSMRLAGVAFLVWCGMTSLLATAAPENRRWTSGPRSRGAAIRSMLIVTWLNPLVYLEAMLLVGLLSTSYGQEMGFWFGLGFLTASALKFYGWTFAAWLFAPSLSQPLHRRVISCASGLVLLTAALLLATQILAGN